MDPSRNPAHLHNLVHMDDHDDDEPEIDDDADMEDDDSAGQRFAVAPVAGSHASSHATASDDFDDDMDDESTNDRQRLSDASVLLNLRGAPASSDHMEDYDDGDDDEDEDEDDHEGDDDDDGDHDDVDEELAALAASAPSQAPSSASSTPKTPRSRKRKSTGGESSTKRPRKVRSALPFDRPVCSLCSPLPRTFAGVDAQARQSAH